MRIKAGEPEQLDEDGGGGKYSQWNIQIDSEVNGQKVIKLQHALTNKFLRIYDDGNKIDVAGIGGKFTQFKVYKTGINSAKLESIEFPGKYPVVNADGPNIGAGDEWSEFMFFRRSAVPLRSPQQGGGLYTYPYYFNQNMQVLMCTIFGTYLRFVSIL